ncbi:MAG: hypothetical protein MNPFHGCM_00324 [Gemmatimonadaceae bacterium]|nr:hypothetical protein [Gemmatimonadaceae bacterium]
MTLWMAVVACARRCMLASAFATAVLAAQPAASRGIPKPPPSPGSELTIYLMTMGQGDLVWEKFGHNAVGVRDERTGTDVVYNWGMFSFDQPGFLPRFLRGEMMYWMAAFDAAQTVVAYIGMNRSVTIQELNIEPSARLALRDFLVWNAREENRFYRYDYFRDNCSTRARDAIDRATGGALQEQLGSVRTAMSYRDHALRLTQDDFLVSTGIDIGLGLPTDRPLTAWQETFIPMSLERRIRDVRVAWSTGEQLPLVRSERVLFSSTRAPEAARPANRAPLLFVVSAGLGLILVLLCTRAGRGLYWARVLTVGWCVVWSSVVGLLGVLLSLLWAATEHQAAYRNMNLLHYQPLWLAVAIATPVAAVHWRRSRTSSAASIARIGATVGAALSILGFLALAFPALRQGFGAPVALAAPLNLAVAFALSRVFPGGKAPTP